MASLPRGALSTLTLLGIPLEAILLEITGAIVPDSHTLQSRIRPLVAGLQIQRGVPGGSIFNCTLGPLVYRSATARWGYLTNSHCTSSMYQADFTTFFQNTYSSGNSIGSEVLDPSGWTCGSNVCRNADAAFIQRTSSVSSSDYDFGHIAKTTSWNGSILIDHSNPKFSIVSAAGAITGSEVDRVAKNSGWSFGTQDTTCYNVTLAGTNKRVLCANRVAYNVAGIGGDSGAPVFRWLTTGYDVEVAGVHFATDSQGGWYSSVEQIEADLGALLWY